MTTTTADETILIIKRMFDAPPAAVFDAWLNREEWQSWIGPEGVNCEVPLLEPHVGGRYRINMKMSDGRMIPVGGEFRAIEKPSLLVFTWGWEGDADKTSLIILTFREASGKTEFTLRQEGLGTVENRDGHEKGWNGTLNKLEKYLSR